MEDEYGTEIEGFYGDDGYFIEGMPEEYQHEYAIERAEEQMVEEEGDDDEEDDEEFVKNEIYVKPEATVVIASERITRPILGIHEFSRLLSFRIMQLNSGSEPFVTGYSSIELTAAFEILERKIPAIIDRELPNGNIERWRLDELTIPRSIRSRYVK